MTEPVECYTPDTTPVGAEPTRDQEIYDANGELIAFPNGTHDECEAVTAATGMPGSRCDKFSQKCTQPFAGREIRPIVWYYTDSSDFRFFEGTNWATQEWNVAMKIAVASARNAECHRTNIDGALAAALDHIPDNDRPSYVIFLTDGLPTAGETREPQIVANAGNIGSDLNPGGQSNTRHLPQCRIGLFGG